jgi:hypothetical protein
LKGTVRVTKTRKCTTFKAASSYGSALDWAHVIRGLGWVIGHKANGALQHEEEAHATQSTSAAKNKIIGVK